MTDTPTDHSRTVREARIRASRILKAARAGDDAALQRLGGRLKRRHALDAAARELMGVSYLELIARAGRPPKADPTRFFERPLAAHWNHWFARYNEAAAHLRESGGFLFPFRRQFVVVDGHVLRTLGLASDHPDWQAIGFDWVRPRDSEAFARLNTMLCEAGFAAEGKGEHDHA